MKKMTKGKQSSEMESHWTDVSYVGTRAWRLLQAEIERRSAKRTRELRRAA